MAGATHPRRIARADFAIPEQTFDSWVPSETDSESLRSFIHKFDFRAEEWSTCETVQAYRELVQRLSTTSRESIYDEVLTNVKLRRINARSLFCFVVFEPHPRLVAKAVQDYLIYRQFDLADEFAGVREVVRALVNGHAVNRGAVLAGLVLIGDRRVNAIARSLRDSLSAADVRDFSRVQLTSIQGRAVEFCLDWLVELTKEFKRSAVEDLACGLNLMAIYDESGLVVGETENDSLVGLASTRDCTLEKFEDYYAEVTPILKYLQQFEGFESPVASIIECWDSHKEEARRLRAASTE